MSKGGFMNWKILADAKSSMFKNKIYIAANMIKKSIRLKIN